MPRITIKGGVWRNTEVRVTGSRLFADVPVIVWQPTSYVPQTLNNSPSMTYISIKKLNN